MKMLGGLLIHISILFLAAVWLTVTIRPVDPPPPPPPEVPGCEITYGPVPTPRDGWEAWGVVCPKGIEP